MRQAEEGKPRSPAPRPGSTRVTRRRPHTSLRLLPPPWHGGDHSQPVPTKAWRLWLQMLFPAPDRLGRLVRVGWTPGVAACLPLPAPTPWKPLPSPRGARCCPRLKLGLCGPLERVEGGTPGKRAICISPNDRQLRLQPTRALSTAGRAHAFAASRLAKPRCFGPVRAARSAGSGAGRTCGECDRVTCVCLETERWLLAEARPHALGDVPWRQKTL